MSRNEINANLAKLQWTFDDRTGFVMHDTMKVAVVHLDCGATDERVEACAIGNLLAAAPELLACLIEMASGHSMAGEARARAAIAKAGGAD